MKLKKTDENQPLDIIDDNQLNQFKSLYYLFKGKRDTDIKIFNDFKQFEYNDIIELNDKVYNKLSLHKVITDIVNVSVGLENKEIKTFGDWNEFINTDWNISAKTKYVIIEWDFNIILPNQTHKVPQTHTLRVKIGNSLNPNELIQVLFQGGDDFEIDEARSQMVCKIDFVNAQICNELKAVVSEWYDALPKNSDDHKLIKFILKHEMKIQNLIMISFLTAGIIFVNILVKQFNQSNYIPTDIALKLFLYLSASVPILYLFHQMGVLYANRITRKQISKLRRNPMFEFTKGDKNKFKEVDKENKKLIRELGVGLFLALLTNGVALIVGLIIKFVIKLL